MHTNHNMIIINTKLRIEVSMSKDTSNKGKTGWYVVDPIENNTCRRDGNWEVLRIRDIGDTVTAAMYVETPVIKVIEFDGFLGNGMPSVRLP